MAVSGKVYKPQARARVRYVRAGWLIDDVCILETGTCDDFESGIGDWEAHGFVYSDNRVAQRYRVQVEDERARRLGERRAAVEEAGEAEVVSPMPGVVVAVLVEIGQEVRTGEGLLILEAMKMENEVRAPHAGTVERVHVSVDGSVELNDELITLR